MAKDKKQLVGKYEAGYEIVTLFVRPGNGGSFTLMTKGDGHSEIEVGYNQEWRRFLATVLHEIQELSLARQNIRYYPYDCISSDVYSFHFFMNHPQFSEMCEVGADFLSRCLDDMTKVWEEQNKDKKV